MMQLGGYQFHVDTAAYQKLQRSDEYRWAQMDRLVLEPSQQWVGIGAKEIELSGTIYPGLVISGSNPTTMQIEAMRAQAALGLPLPMVDGRGYYYGLWCIKTVEESASEFMDHGGPRKQGFTMKLVRQGEDETLATLATAAAGAVANIFGGAAGL